MNNSETRNKQGAWIAFVLGLLFSGLGVCIMVAREQTQASKGGFPVEIDDVLRYTQASGFGAFINMIVWMSIALC